MSNTYTWSVNSLVCYPTYETQTDVVFTVYWTCEATSGEFSSSTSQSTAVSWTQGSPFTPYNQLTQDQVIGWVQQSLGAEGVADVYHKLDLNLQNQEAPTVVAPPLPWATN